MCQALIDAARAAGWVAQPETAGYDIVLVSSTGLKIGVEAKRTAGIDVLSQAWRRSEEDESTNVTAVFCPDSRKTDFGCICRALGLMWFVAPPPSSAHLISLYLATWEALCQQAKLREPTKALPILHVPTAIAGAQAPLKLTEWKLKAVQFCIDHKDSERITRAALVAAHLSPTIWMRKWLQATQRVQTENGRGAQGYRLRDVPGRPDLLYNDITDALLRAGATR